MGMQINTNVAALNSYRNLSNTQNDLSKSLEKLSSGLRINRAADDAAGLAISEGLRSQINGLNVAVRNAQDGVSVIQTAEGTLTEVHSILQRLRDLAVQAGNDSNSTEARTAIGNEANGLVTELDRIAKSTNFNGINLLDGTAGAASNGRLAFQVGANGDASSQIVVDLAAADVDNVATALKNRYSASSLSVATPGTVAGIYNFVIAEGPNTTTSIAVNFGAANAANTINDIAAKMNAEPGFAGRLTATVNGANILVADKEGKLVDTLTTGTGAAGLGAMTDGTAGALSFATAAGAQAAITAIDGQIDTISGARAALGAVQNRFESAINSLNVSSENLSAAESRIRDTDMAQEMVAFTRAQILSQAGTAMLAQANSSNQGVLQLLQG
jgi:flagellin